MAVNSNESEHHREPFARLPIVPMALAALHRRHLTTESNVLTALLAFFGFETRSMRYARIYLLSKQMMQNA